MMVFIGFFMLVTVAIYVISAIFLMKLLRHTGHRRPWAAWVPIMNTAALLEIGGFANAWPWVAVLLAASVVAGAVAWIPVVGWLLFFAVVVFAIMITVWIARGVHAGLGMKSTGGVVLAVLLPIVWVIWMSVVAGKARYNVYAAMQEAQTFPLKWFTANPSFPANTFDTPADPAPSGEVRSAPM